MRGRREALADVSNLVEPAARAELLQERGQRLGLTGERIDELAALEPRELEGQVIRLTYGQGLDARKARIREAEHRAEQAAAELSRTARWEGNVVHVEPGLLLGGLLAHPGSKHIGFVLGDGEPICFEKARLRPARRALAPFPDLAARLDADGLHFRWRGGLGGVNLFPRLLSPYERWQAHLVTLVRPADVQLEAAIIDESQAPRPAPSSSAAPSERPPRPAPPPRAPARAAWLGDILGDLGLLA